MLENAWKDIKEHNKRMLTALEGVDSYDAEIMEDAELRGITLMSEKAKIQAEKKSFRYRSANETYRKFIKKKH